MNRIAVSLVLAVFGAALLPAQTGAQAPTDAAQPVPAAQPAATAKPAKPVTECRERAHVTGSHIPAGRRCKTAEQWAAEDERLTQVPVDMRFIRTSDKPIEGSH